MRGRPTKEQAHLLEREQITQNCIDAWMAANRQFAMLLAKARRPRADILEERRLLAIASYEALLDSVACERTALMLVHAANQRPQRGGEQA